MTEHETTDISLSQIAKRSGLDASLVKYYFGSKKGLMLALLEDVLDPWVNKMPALLGSDFCAVEKLRIYIKSIVAVYFRYPFMSRLIQYVFEDEVLGEKVAASISKPMASVLKKIIQEGVVSGDMKPVDPVLFYLIILGSCDQLFFSRNILRAAFGVELVDDRLYRQYSKTILDIVLGGVLLAPPSIDQESLIKRLEQEGRRLRA